MVVSSSKSLRAFSNSSCLTAVLLFFSNSFRLTSLRENTWPMLALAKIDMMSDTMRSMVSESKLDCPVVSMSMLIVPVLGSSAVR